MMITGQGPGTREQVLCCRVGQEIEIGDGIGVAARVGRTKDVLYQGNVPVSDLQEACPVQNLLDS